MSKEPDIILFKWWVAGLLSVFLFLSGLWVLATGGSLVVAFYAGIGGTMWLYLSVDTYITGLVE